MIRKYKSRKAALEDIPNAKKVYSGYFKVRWMLDLESEEIVWFIEIRDEDQNFVKFY